MFPHSFDCLLQSVPFLFGGCPKADDDGHAVESRLDYCTAEIDQQLLMQLKLPELKQKMYPLLCFLHDCSYIGSSPQ